LIDKPERTRNPMIKLIAKIMTRILLSILAVVVGFTMVVSWEHLEPMDKAFVLTLGVILAGLFTVINLIRRSIKNDSGMSDDRY
jgi:hypothetical protein